jgi:uncharacterized Fe-S cluster protein YjdI
MPLNTHKYSNGEITIIWQPNICIHSGICAKGLIEVFDPRRKPWINMSSSDSETIKAQIKKCPSGALSYIEAEDK